MKGKGSENKNVKWESGSRVDQWNIHTYTSYTSSWAGESEWIPWEEEWKREKEEKGAMRGKNQVDFLPYGSCKSFQVRFSFYLFFAHKLQGQTLPGLWSPGCRKGINQSKEWGHTYFGSSNFHANNFFFSIDNSISFHSSWNFNYFSLFSSYFCFLPRKRSLRQYSIESLIHLTGSQVSTFFRD